MSLSKQTITYEQALAGFKPFGIDVAKARFTDAFLEEEHISLTSANPTQYSRPRKMSCLEKIASAIYQEGISASRQGGYADFFIASGNSNPSELTRRQATRDHRINALVFLAGSCYKPHVVPLLREKYANYFERERMGCAQESQASACDSPARPLSRHGKVFILHMC